MTIRFGTFNLFQFCEPPYSWYIKKDRFKEEEWKEKTAWIKKQISQMNCDIIGFQEVFSNSALEELVKELGFKYFVTVDTPKLEKETVYTSTTLALASKYPILKTQNVDINTPTLKKHQFKGRFSFSRAPIKALIELPNSLQITVYVNHFKSNRLNEFEYIFNKETSLKEKKEKVKEALKQNYSPALKQRLCETSSLFFNFKKCKTPIICMCDLNDKEFSLSIDALTNRSYHDEKKKFNSYLLYDSYRLNSKKEYNPHPEKKQERTPTSYYMSYGNVLDYIFVSKEFNKKDKNSIGKVISYEVLNEHLKDNPDGSLLQSDHAQVVCEIELFNK